MRTEPLTPWGTPLWDPLHPQTVALTTRIARMSHRHPGADFDTGFINDRIVRAMELRGIHSELVADGLKIVVRGTRPERSRPRRAIAFRGDSDALEMTEQTNLPWRSRIPGVAHTCGHDLHTGWCAGGADDAHRNEDKFSDDAVFIVQPGEESTHLGGGAVPMIRAGVLENPHVHAIFGLHVDPSQRTGKLLMSPGPVNAAVDDFTIWISHDGPVPAGNRRRFRRTFQGVEKDFILRVAGTRGGGHGAHPESALDPMPCVGNLLMLLQNQLAGAHESSDPMGLAIWNVAGGVRQNAMAEFVDICATARAGNFRELKRLLDDVAQIVAPQTKLRHLKADILPIDKPIGTDDPDWSVRAWNARSRAIDRRTFLCAASTISTLYSELIPRGRDVMEPALMTIGMIEGTRGMHDPYRGIELQGTIRSFDDADRGNLERRFSELVAGQGASFGLEAVPHVTNGYPSVHNDPTMVRWLSDALTSLKPLLNDPTIPEVGRQQSSLGGDDFAEFVRALDGRGGYFNVTVGNPEIGADRPTHSAGFIYDPAAVPVGLQVIRAGVQAFPALGFR
jgi:metal-dependent amidase/aminoacylase/carboxypeptidase family protein